MATVARSAPLPGSDTLVADAQYQAMVQNSRDLIQKILLAIPKAHKSSIQSQALELNSTENSKYSLMATTIGIRSPPVLKVVSEDFSLETCLKRMSEGLQLHRALLGSVSPRLENKDKVTGLMDDIRDLVIQINKMLKKVQGEAVVLPTPAPVTLNLPGDYEVQVATHLTLVQLQSFGQDVVRSLRSLDQSNEEETES